MTLRLATAEKGRSCPSTFIPVLTAGSLPAHGGHAGPLPSHHAHCRSHPEARHWLVTLPNPRSLLLPDPPALLPSLAEAHRSRLCFF